MSILTCFLFGITAPLILLFSGILFDNKLCSEISPITVKIFSAITNTIKPVSMRRPFPSPW